MKSKRLAPHGTYTKRNDIPKYNGLGPNANLLFADVVDGQAH